MGEGITACSHGGGHDTGGAQRLADSVAVMAMEAALAVDEGRDSVAKGRLYDIVVAVDGHAKSHGGAGVW